MRHAHKHAHMHIPLKWVDRWYVTSHSNANREYTVSRANDGETWGCSCPHWTRNFPRPTCKHIREVWESLAEDGVNPINNVRFDEFFTEEEFKLKI
jgi:hypothetical protein